METSYSPPSGAESAPQTTGQETSQTAEPTAAEYMAALQHLDGEVKGLKSERDSTSKAVRDNQETMDRIRRAVSGEQETAEEVDPDSEFLNLFLDEALKDQKAGGQGLPLTTKLAMEAAAHKKEIRELKAMVQKLASGQQQQNDPEVLYDREAYGRMDLQIQGALKNIYGEINPRLFQAITAEVGGEIQRLKREKPQIWQEIRRNPDHMQRMSLHFVEKFVPPKARQMMLEDKERNTPMTRSELNQAMREADQIQDQGTRAKIKESIRQKILEEMVNKKR
jgi:hypothetical protein